jgi:hypothetical protein
VLYCGVFVSFDFVLCIIPNVCGVSSLSILDCPFGFLVFFKKKVCVEEFKRECSKITPTCSPEVKGGV